VAALRIRTPEGNVLSLPIAGAGSRFAAGLCDGFLVGCLYLIAFLLGTLILGVDPTGLSGLFQGVPIMGLPLILAGYHFGFHAFGRGATPGKRLLGLRVMSVDGDPPTVLQHALRSAIWPLDVLVPVPVPLGVVVIACSRRRQRIGDHVAGTLVVRDDALTESQEPFPGERWSRLSERTLALHAGTAARFSDADLDFLRSLLAREGLPTERRRRLFVEAARHFSARLGLKGFDDARVVLKELYLFLREAREGARVSPARPRTAAPGGAPAAPAPPR
jgi:uncharacterized RDD family membrane protein YckC